jgi:hypothetical protein
LAHALHLLSGGAKLSLDLRILWPQGISPTNLLDKLIRGPSLRKSAHVEQVRPREVRQQMHHPAEVRHETDYFHFFSVV